MAVIATLGLGTATALAQSTCLPPQPPPPPCGCDPSLPPPLDPTPPSDPMPPSDPTPPGPAFHARAALSSPSVVESDKSVKFTVSLPGDACDAEISFHTVDGTATAGDDYEATSGHVTVDFLDPEAEVKVPIIDDTLDEDDETFKLVVDGGDGGGTATIVDNDDPPTVSVGNATVTEGTATGAVEQFPVTLSAPSGKTVTVDYATAAQSAGAGTDFQPEVGTLSFPPGTTQQTIPVPIVGDPTGEPDETFDLVLSGAQGATIAAPMGVGTIVNDDPLEPPGGTGGGGGGGGAGGQGNTGNQSHQGQLPDGLPPVIIINTPVQANGTLIWTVTCPATEQECDGKVKVTTTQTGRAAKAAAVMAKKSRVIKLGSATYRLKGGETKKVKVRLNGNGRRLVRKKGNVPAKATFTTSDKSGNVSKRTQNITLHPVILRHS